MTNSTVATVSSAIPDLPALVALLTPELQALYDHVQAFRQQPPTPERTCALEKNIAASLMGQLRANNCPMLTRIDELPD